MNHERLDYIDVAKGLGILLVMLGHIYTTPMLNKFIYAFHMPLFFIIAGYTFNTEKYKAYSFKAFLHKKAAAYIVPYFIYAAINFVIFGVGKSLLSYGLTKEFLTKTATYVYGILYSIASTEYMPNCTPLWFLTCLFVSEMVLFVIMKHSGHISLWMAFFLIINIALVRFQAPTLPWNMNVATIGITFMYIGILIRKKPKLIRPSSLFLTVPVFVLFTLQNSEVNLAAMRFGNYLYMYISAVSGSLAVLSVSVLCKRSGLLKFYGQNTMCIIGTNYALNSLFSLYGAYVTIVYHWIWVYINIVLLATALICILKIGKNNPKTHKLCKYL